MGERGLDGVVLAQAFPAKENKGTLPRRLLFLVVKKMRRIFFVHWLLVLDLISNAGGEGYTGRACCSD